MTDTFQSNTAVAGSQPGKPDIASALRKGIAKRYGAEARFKFLGLGAVLLSCLFLIILLSTIVTKAIPAFTSHVVTLPVDLSAQSIGLSSLPTSEEYGTLQLSPAELNSEGIEETDDVKALRGLNYDGLVRDSLRELFPNVKGRTDRRALNRLTSAGAGFQVRTQMFDDPTSLIGQDSVTVLLDDEADLYYKGLTTDKVTLETSGLLGATGTEGEIQLLADTNTFGELVALAKQGLQVQADRVRRDASAQGRSLRQAQTILETMQRRIDDAGVDVPETMIANRDEAQRRIDTLTSQIENLQAQAQALDARIAATGDKEPLDNSLPSMLVYINGGVAKVLEVSTTGLRADVLRPLQSTEQTADWSLVKFTVPERSRKLNDQAIIWLDELEAQGRIEQTFNTTLFTAGASREPELAGIWGAVVGSFFTMMVTLVLSFPLGVAAAIYLEEFAPKNRLTTLIEVNINNLAAVPSIVFGLLGLAIFLNVFGMPRSAPVVGGAVLALMTLPTIIIASRAAIKAVPPSIREGAMGIGASKLQTVFHHVLPLAMPGIFTGTIIGMAQALGETAPLLMIGMVAFITGIPSGPLDAATVMPVQIFLWADLPETLFQHKTSAAILTLLAFLVIMNAIAVILRKRFERRW